MILCLILNGMDILSGVVSAAFRGKLTAHKLAQGIFHKTAFLLLYLLVFVLDKYLPAYGFLPQLNLLPIMVPIVVAIEIISICENICKINPELTPDLLKKIFGALEEKDE